MYRVIDELLVKKPVFCCFLFYAAKCSCKIRDSRLSIFFHYDHIETAHGTPDDRGLLYETYMGLLPCTNYSAISQLMFDVGVPRTDPVSEPRYGNSSDLRRWSSRDVGPFRGGHFSSASSVRRASSLCRSNGFVRPHCTLNVVVAGLAMRLGEY